MTGNERMLVINKLGEEEGNTSDQQSNVGEMIFLITQIKEFWRQNEELKSDLQAFIVFTSSLLRHMNDSIHKVVAAPTIMRRQLNNEKKEVNEANENQFVMKIPLIKCPITLLILWK